MAIDDPTLMEILAGGGFGSPRQDRQYFYLNLWFQFLRTGFIEMTALAKPGC
jgi:hypothetical protein